MVTNAMKRIYVELSLYNDNIDANKHDKEHTK